MDLSWFAVIFVCITCICVCVYVHACMYVRIRTRLCGHIPKGIPTSILVTIYYVCVCVCVPVYLPTQTCAYVHVHIYAYVCLCMFVCICMRAYMCKYIRNLRHDSCTNMFVYFCVQMVKLTSQSYLFTAILIASTSCTGK